MPALRDLLWPERFAPFGALHGVVVALSVLAWAAVVVSARRVRGTAGERRWRRGAALLVWGFNVAWQARLLLPDRFAWGHSLPLHLCDLAWMAAGWSLWCGGEPSLRRHQVPVLWGVALSLLAYATPAVTAGPGGLPFWTFWITHAQILAVALVNLLAFGTRIDGRGLRAALGVAAAGLVAATGVNLALGTSYFFTGDTLPENPTPLDALGPWPLRILWVALLGAAALVVVAAVLGAAAPRRRAQERNIASP